MGAKYPLTDRVIKVLTVTQIRRALKNYERRPFAHNNIINISTGGLWMVAACIAPVRGALVEPDEGYSDFLSYTQKGRDVSEGYADASDVIFDKTGGEGNPSSPHYCEEQHALGKSGVVRKLKAELKRRGYAEN